MALVDKQPEIGEWNKYYSINYYCGKHGYASYLKGVPKHKIKCSNCECEVEP